MSDVRPAWNAAKRKLFTAAADSIGYSGDSRGLFRHDADVSCAVVCLEKYVKATGELRLTFEMRIWVRWMREFLGFLDAFELEYGFPPVRYWYRREDSADLDARWDDSFWFSGGTSVPEWLVLKESDQIADAVDLVDEVIRTRMIPVLVNMSNPSALVEFWMGTYDPPHASLTALRSAAVTAHGLGDMDSHDQALARLDSLADSYPWHSGGHVFATQVRRWVRI